jgi:hypothetical protein
MDKGQRLVRPISNLSPSNYAIIPQGFIDDRRHFHFMGGTLARGSLGMPVLGHAKMQTRTAQFQLNLETNFGHSTDRVAIHHQYHIMYSEPESMKRS